MVRRNSNPCSFIIRLFFVFHFMWMLYYSSCFLFFFFVCWYDSNGRFEWLSPPPPLSKSTVPTLSNLRLFVKCPSIKTIIIDVWAFFALFQQFISTKPVLPASNSNWIFFPFKVFIHDSCAHFNDAISSAFVKYIFGCYTESLLQNILK